MTAAAAASVTPIRGYWVGSTIRADAFGFGSIGLEKPDLAVPSVLMPKYRFINDGRPPAVGRTFDQCRGDPRRRVGTGLYSCRPRGSAVEAVALHLLCWEGFGYSQ